MIMLEKRNQFFFILIVTLLFSCNTYGQDFNRMTLLIDKNDEGPTENKKQSLVTTFGINIHQSASPVIASYSVVNAFLMLQAQKYNLPQNASAAQQALQETIAILNLVSFDQSEWQIYWCKNSQFFLFVPKSMASMIAPQSIVLPDKTVSAPTLNMNTLEEFLPSSSTLQQWVANKYDANQDVQAKQISSLFFSDDDIKANQALLDSIQNIDTVDEKISLIRSSAKPWNFFIQGHGSYAPRAARKRIINFIAGLATQEFNNLLLFFTTINTNVVAISSCYSGGQNLDYLQLEKQTEKFVPSRNYILAILSSGDQPTTTQGSRKTVTVNNKGTTTSSSHLSVDEGINIQNYFTELEKQIEKSIPTSSARQSHLNWLTNALTYLARDGSGNIPEQNIPQISIPHVGWFQAFSPVKNSKGFQDPSFLIIGDVLLKKHDIQNSPINIRNKRTLLVYPTLVPATLHVTASPNSKFPTILSMQHGDAVHTIDSITLQSSKTGQGVQAFLIDAFFDRLGRQSKKTFLIKTLTGPNDVINLAKDNAVTLNNVLIQSSLESTGQVFELFFEINGIFYHGQPQQPGSTNLVYAHIAQDEYNKALAPFRTLLADLQQEKPVWKIAKKTIASISPKSDIERKLFELKNRLETLASKLQELRGQLRNLRSQLKPVTLPQKYKPLLDAAKERNIKLKVCYDLLNNWIKNPPIIEDATLQNQLLTLCQNISGVLTDSKMNFADLMLAKLDTKTIRVVFLGLWAVLEKNKTNQKIVYELVALSLTLYRALEVTSGKTQAAEQQQWHASNNVQNYLQTIYNIYLQNIQKLSLNTLEQQTQKHFCLAQLCIFFAAVNVKEPKMYAWIGNVLPLLKINDEHKKQIAEKVISFQRFYGSIPEFGQLVAKLGSL